MSYTAITASLIEAGKANVRSLWSLISTNLSDHQDRLNTLEQNANLINAGTIVWYGSSATPTGYLKCDGSIVSRETYTSLFAVVGETYGAGDGASTFQLPDLRGRSPLGSGTGSGLTARTAGTSVGEETHVLTSAEIASHTHSIAESPHTHTWPAVGSAGAGTGQTESLGSSTDEQTSFGGTGISMQNTGSGTGHNTMQPFAVATALIKY